MKLRRLLLDNLGPHRGLIAFLVLFQALQTTANLVLPAISARLIDDGVLVGDRSTIWRLGGLMVVVSIVQVVFAAAAMWFAARLAIGFGRDVRRDLFRRVVGFSGREVTQFGAPSLTTRITNDIQQVQLLLVMVATMMIAAPAHDGDRHHPRHPRGHRPGDDPARGGAARDHRARARDQADGAVVRTDAGPHRPGQHGAARADHRRARRARVHPRARGVPSLRRRQRRTDGDVDARLPPDGGDVPDRHADRQPVGRRRAVDRRRPGRRRLDGDRLADRLPHLHDADPERRDVGDVHAVDDPPRRRRGDPHRRGARHRNVGPPQRPAREQLPHARNRRVPWRHVPPPRRTARGARRRVVPVSPPARRRPSSARPVPARPRSSSSPPASWTRPPATC